MKKRINVSKLPDYRVAVLATTGFEESELTEPVKALKKAGARVTILSPKPGKIQGVHMAKDLRLALETAAELSVPLEQTGHLKDIYNRGITAGWSDDDFIGLMRLVH